MDPESEKNLEAAEGYLDELVIIRNNIRNAEKQILSTYKSTVKVIQTTFSNLKKQLCDALENRENVLLAKAEQIMSDGLFPIRQCGRIVEDHIGSTNGYIVELNAHSTEIESNLTYYTELWNLGMLLGNLPEVPDLKDVPQLSFYYEPVNAHDLESICLNLGEVFRVAPVQIKDLTPKPGAILIEWEQVNEQDEEKTHDIKEYRLQRTFGDYLNSSDNSDDSIQFIDCYRGPDTQYLHRDIIVDETYSFRVCCQYDGSSEWTPWSIAQVGTTPFDSFSWKREDGLTLVNENKIVEINVNEEGENMVAISNGPQLRLQDSIEFTIIEIEKKGDVMLALLVDKPENEKQLKSDTKSFFSICSNGKVFVNGIEKSTVMPPFSKGSKVCFSLEQLAEDRVRVHVDSNDKRVTYDWTINNCIKLFFACQVTSSKTKVMVE